MSTWEQELGELKVRVERLEETVRQLAETAPPVASPEPDQLADQEQLVAWRKTEGLVRSPTAEEQRLAAEWDTLPAEEKQAHLRFMRSLLLDPPLSQLISESRRIQGLWGKN
jgi:phosphate uptake regulator